MLAHSQSLLKYSSHDDLEEFRDMSQPLPLSMLGYFGDIIATYYSRISDKEWNFLSSCIEKGLASKDDDIRIAVATGLIEVIIHQAETVEGLWPTILARLGPAAQRYVEYYNSIDYDLPYMKNSRS